MKNTPILFVFVLSILLGCNGKSSSPPDIEILSPNKELTSFSFLMLNNPSLTENIYLTIENLQVTGRVPLDANINALIPTYEYNGESIRINAADQFSEVHANNFSEIVHYQITAENNSTATYNVDLTYFTGLPLLYIYTDDGIDITSKDEYVLGHADFYKERKYFVFSEPIKIRGRGNSTWRFPKKPYQLKFDEKISIASMPVDKKWILLANYSDKTMLRNKAAFDLGELSRLDWTPKSEFIELFVNDAHQGTYQISQKVEESKNRANITNDGFLLEVDQLVRLDEDDVYFQSTRLLFNIKDPDTDYDDDNYVYIKNYIIEVENVLYSDEFQDPIHGYAKYLDVESFVDWYLVNEISKNNDAIFYSSVYMTHIPGEKLKMGPLWDYDLAFGNVNYNDNESPEGFWIKNSPWIARLFQDPEFVAQVQERFNYFKNNKDAILNKITSNALGLDNAQYENDVIWNTLGVYVWPNYEVFPTYSEEVAYLKQWIELRFTWLETAIGEF